MQNAPEPTDALTQNQYVISSAYRTLQVLLAFGAPPHRFSLAELTARMEPDKGQIYRSLKTLEEAGFLRMNADGRFSLTPLLGVLGAASADTRGASLVDVAGPYLDWLGAQTGETVHLFALAGEVAVCVDRRESTYPVRLSSVLGLSVPLHAGASPKAILAHLPEEVQAHILAQLSGYPRYTGKTVTDPEALREELQEIRALGYAISDEDVDVSARGVGAPVFDHAGGVVGGVSLGGPSFRVDDEALREFGELILQGARAISKGLGYPG